MTPQVRSLRQCPGCGHDQSAAVDLGGPVLRRCASCALVFAPEYADPGDVYVEGYLTGATAFGLDVRHPVFQEYLQDVARRRLEVLEAVVGHKGSLLDVGCGSGEVLAVARARGWSATGCEPVPESAEMARRRGLEVRAALLQDSGLPERSFDVVAAFHVLEHIPNGVEFLRMLARWAKPGGHVLIEVPNWQSIHRRNTGGLWPNLRPLEHVAHYQPSTLRATMQRAGLEPLTLRTPTYLFHRQTLQEALEDLGRRRWARRFRPLSKTAPHHHGDLATVPNRAGWQVLKAMAAVHSAAKVGAVVLGVARVP